MLWAGGSSVLPYSISVTEDCLYSGELWVRHMGVLSPPSLCGVRGWQSCRAPTLKAFLLKRCNCMCVGVCRWTCVFSGIKHIYTHIVCVHINACACIHVCCIYLLYSAQLDGCASMIRLHSEKIIYTLLDRWPIVLGEKCYWGRKVNGEVR